MLMQVMVEGVDLPFSYLELAALFLVHSELT